MITKFKLYENKENITELDFFDQNLTELPGLSQCKNLEYFML